METALYTYHINPWNFVILLLPLAVSVLFLFFGKWYARKNPAASYRHRRHTVIIGRCLSGVTFTVFALALTATLIQTANINNAYISGNYSVVEGPVTDFHEEKNGLFDGKKENEHFKIGDVCFEYTFASLQSGYHRPVNLGGVITGNRQHLKIKYLTDAEGNHTILYIAKITDQ